MLIANISSTFLITQKNTFAFVEYFFLVFFQHLFFLLFCLPNLYVAGGTEAALNKHPWQAESSIFTFNILTSAAQVSLEGFKHCGGSLISKYIYF